MQVSLLQALLLALWAGWCSFDDVGPQWLRRPLLIGPIVGLVLGDLQQSLVISATLELMWMGLGNMAGYKAPDMIIGTIVGTTFGIVTGEGVATGVTLAVPAALLAQQIEIIYGAARQAYSPIAKKYVEQGDIKGVYKLNAISFIIQFLYRAIPTFIIVYLGNGVIEKALKFIPKDVLGGLTIASKIVPAVGLAILMTVILKGAQWIFILLGFALTAYLELPVIAVTIISLAFAFLYDLAMNANQGGQVVKQTSSDAGSVDDDFDEEDYDL